MAKQTKIVEIGGVKLEVDLRYCRTIEHFVIGQNVKVLKKGYSSYDIYSGVIVSFDNFVNMPTIIVACLKTDSYEPDIFLVNINSATTDVEIVPMATDEILFDKKYLLEKFDQHIMKKQGEIDDIKAKRQYFVDRYNTAFEDHVVKFKE
jgi:hypothetical protein